MGSGSFRTHRPASSAPRRLVHGNSNAMGRGPDMIGSMAPRIVPADVMDIQQVLADHSRYWGGRDLRGLHLMALVHEFGSTCLVARDEDGIR
jgi:hypothetical protein